MSTHLSRFFRRQRLDRKLSLGTLAERCGYRNVAKGANRIQKFEGRGDIHPELFAKLKAVLEVDDDTVSELVDHDHREHVAAWLKWVNEPVRMVARIRRAPSFVPPLPVPEDIVSQDEAERWAAEQTERWGPLLLHVNRKVSVAFDADGNITERFEASPDSVALPYQKFGRCRVRFTVGPDGIGVTVDHQPTRPPNVSDHPS